MLKALIRWEDIEPGLYYNNEIALKKLKIIGDYLKSQNVPFQISLIPRSVIPENNYDKSIDDTTDPFINLFNSTIKYLQENCRASLGMHGYTHQYSMSASGDGFEFSSTECPNNCPPNDPIEATIDSGAFKISYAYSRMLKGYTAYNNSGLTLNWGFSTPHYDASKVQRNILEASSGIFFENDPDNPTASNIITKDTDSPFFRGVIYVPTQLGYVSGANPEADVQRILSNILRYNSTEIPAFFYHPFLEFSFIQINQDGSFTYDDNSYLKQLINGFKQQGYSFVPMISLTDFVPASRLTNIFPGNGFKVLTSQAKKNQKTNFVVWEIDKGNWYFTNINIVKFPNRQNVIQSADVILALDDWATGSDWIALVGDFNGDDTIDVVVWYYKSGQWQVALNDNLNLVPNVGPGNFIWLDNWAIGNSWTPLIGDFNGDGIDDIVVWNSEGGNWQVALSTGNQFIPSAGPGNYIWLDNWAVGSDWVPLVGDFNGDGKDDIAVYNYVNGGWQVALSNGSEFIPSAGKGDYLWLSSWGVGKVWTPLIGDFDGDGKSDILVVDKVNGIWQIAYSDGSQFIPSENVFGPWDAGADMEPFVADLTGLGKAGLIARRPNSYNGTFDGAFNVIGSI